MEELGEVVGGEEQDSGASLHTERIRRMINYWWCICGVLRRFVSLRQGSMFVVELAKRRVAIRISCRSGSVIAARL